ncbi:Uma2 family endonuclease [Actinophytocola oryzae]|uniref:Uma2 family endonuclease n=1 Tax=Actinophytocola oryzae TaxID=502181 RepID=A0A4R7UPD7_9PSEU|nr:Uma2 family endonuclease [Actinophytocola oryzae]TDV35407.1 Uma2 family endonuclease [Actinophytocola oryzae]
MTAQPLDDLEADSVHLLTIGEYAALGETEHGYAELVEGRLLMSPSPAYRHSRAMVRLCTQLIEQTPQDLEVVLELDVDLELASPDEPGSSRRPDLMVVRRELGDRLAAEGGLVAASEVLLAVEIVSPSSKRMDHVHKRMDYADAGIPTYWIVDIDEPISLTACQLTEEFGYVDDQTATGTFTTKTPFPVEVSLDRLV